MKQRRPVDSEGYHVENTRQMSLEPRNREAAVFAPGASRNKTRVNLTLTGDDFRRLVDYPIIVEAWDKKGQHGVGRIRRKWLETFTTKERATLGRYYPKLYTWYLVTGTPAQLTGIKPGTLSLLQRATSFFAHDHKPTEYKYEQATT